MSPKTLVLLPPDADDEAIEELVEALTGDEEEEAEDDEEPARRHLKGTEYDHDQSEHGKWADKPGMSKEQFDALLKKSADTVAVRQEAEQRLKAAGYERVDLTEMDPDYVPEVTDALVALAERYPAVPRELGVGVIVEEFLNDGAYARVSVGDSPDVGQWMLFNAKWFGRGQAELRDALDRDSRRGWAVAASRGIRSLVEHEFGHLVDVLHDFKVPNGKLVAAERRYPSRYSRYSQNEWFAEVFAAIQGGTDYSSVSDGAFWEGVLQADLKQLEKRP